jgi:hypothetical protein
MSGVPTSAAEPPDAAALARAGWSDAELTWEHVQEAAAEALAGGGWDTAASLWRTALTLARETFEPGDPRLAASLANQAVAARHGGDGEAATALFDEARAVWEACGPWVAALAPERRSRSSLFHLRLERKHPSGYDHHSRARYEALAEEGREVTEGLAAGSAEPRGALARWRAERPAGYSDGRKLLAAVLLLADPPA